jgi:hypothetical protein
MNELQKLLGNIVPKGLPLSIEGNRVEGCWHFSSPDMPIVGIPKDIKLVKQLCNHYELSCVELGEFVEIDIRKIK